MNLLFFFALIVLPGSWTHALKEITPARLHRDIALDKRKSWLSPPFTWLFQFPLPIPSVKSPKLYESTTLIKVPVSQADYMQYRTVTNPVTGRPIDYYEIFINPFSQKIYPDRGNASLVGYDGRSPGPTFIVEKGRETVVRFVNNASMDNSVHLHGSYSVSFSSP